MSIGDFCGQPYEARGDIWQCFMPADHPLDCTTLNTRRHDIAVRHVALAEEEFDLWYQTLVSARAEGVELTPDGTDEVLDEAVLLYKHAGQVIDRVAAAFDEPGKTHTYVVPEGVEKIEVTSFPVEPSTPVIPVFAGGRTQWLEVTPGEILKVDVVAGTVTREGPVTHPCGACGQPLTAEQDAFHDCVGDIEMDVVHLPQPDGSCKVSVNGQGHLPCNEHVREQSPIPVLQEDQKFERPPGVTRHSAW